MAMTPSPDHATLSNEQIAELQAKATRLIDAYKKCEVENLSTSNRFVQDALFTFEKATKPEVLIAALTELQSLRTSSAALQAEVERLTQQNELLRRGITENVCKRFDAEDALLQPQPDRYAEGLRDGLLMSWNQAQDISIRHCNSGAMEKSLASIEVRNAISRIAEHLHVDLHGDLAATDAIAAEIEAHNAKGESSLVRSFKQGLDRHIKAFGYGQAQEQSCSPTSDAIRAVECHQDQIDAAVEAYNSRGFGDCAPAAMLDALFAAGHTPELETLRARVKELEHSTRLYMKVCLQAERECDRADAAEATITDLRAQLAAKGTADVPGADWKLSDRAKQELKDIDDNLRRGAIEAGDIRSGGA